MSFPELSPRTTDPAATWRFVSDVEQAGVVRFLAPGDQVGGEFGLFENAADPGVGPAPHFHTTFSESFYVLSGRLAVMAGRQWQVLGSGDFASVPADGMHTFRGVGDETARFLILFVPAGAPRERYFRGLAEFGRRDTPPSREEVDDFARSCDQVNVHDWVSDPIPEWTRFPSGPGR